MSRIGNDLVRGMKQLRTAAGSPTFRWNGKDYDCVANEAGSSKIFGVGGFALEADLSLFVELALLPTPGPKEKQTLSYKAKTYRIDHVASLPGDSIVKLVCNDPTKGA